MTSRIKSGPKPKWTEKTNPNPTPNTNPKSKPKIQDPPKMPADKYEGEETWVQNHNFLFWRNK